MRRCVYRKQLDLETLVATRGPNFSRVDLFRSFHLNPDAVNGFA
jgi:hypothetical protein